MTTVVAVAVILLAAYGLYPLAFMSAKLIYWRVKWLQRQR